MGRRKRQEDTVSSDNTAPDRYLETGQICGNLLESDYMPDYFSSLKGANLRALDSFQCHLLADREPVAFPHPAPWKRHNKQDYTRAFATWMLLLEQGINLLMYGAGSKMSLVTAFVEEIRREKGWGVVRAQGGMAVCSLRKILEGLMEAFGVSSAAVPGHKDPQFLVEHLLSSLEDRRNSGCPPCLLVIDNIDGPALLKPEVQSMLSKLAASRAILLLATVDSPHISLLWTLSAVEAFNFLYAECPTYEEYYGELAQAKEPLELFPKGAKSNEIRGIRLILNSMTSTHKAILQLLAHTLQSQSLSGIPLKQFFSQCKQDTLVSSEKQLKEYLIEAKDHELIDQRKDRKGQVTLSFRLPDEVVRLIATGKIYT